MAAKERGLGRGFDALIPTVIEAEFDPSEKLQTTAGEAAVAADSIQDLPPELVDPNPHQPRQNFDEEQLEELAESIKAHGIVQPLVATRVGERYQLIAGERRLRAAKLAGLGKVPVIVRSYDQQKQLEVALIENIQRQNLNPIETAAAYRKLLDQFNLSQHQLGRQLGKKQSTIANTIRLMALPLEAKRAIVKGDITEGHGRAILALTDPEQQQILLEQIIKHGWTVRQAEEYARTMKQAGATKRQAMTRVTATNDLTRELSTFLGTKVTLQRTAKGGRLQIEYYSDEELQRIYDAIKRAE